MLEFSFVGLFARALEGIDVKQLITNVGAGVGTAPAAGAAPAAAAADSAAKEEKKEEKKEESDMSDDDMGFGKFEMFSGLSYATCIRILGKVLCNQYWGKYCVIQQPSCAGNVCCITSEMMAKG